MRRRTRTPVHYEIEYSTWKQWEIQQIGLLLIELQQISYCQSRSRVHEKWCQMFSGNFGEKLKPLYLYLLKIYYLLKSFSFEAKAGSIKINSRDWLQGLMQKQVEVKNISYFKIILYSVQKQGEFKIVFVKESFDMFLCREAGWGHNFLLGIPDFYLIKCGGGLGDLLTVNWINICASTHPKIS